MFKLLIGFILGFIVATAGVGGIVGLADKGVTQAKETIVEQTTPTLKEEAKAKWDAELKEAQEMLRKK